MSLETAKKYMDLLFAEDVRNSELVNDSEAHDACRVDLAGVGSYDRAICFGRSGVPSGEVPPNIPCWSLTQNVEICRIEQK